MRIDSPIMTNVIATGSFSGSFDGNIAADSVEYANILNKPVLISGSIGTGGGSIAGIGGDGVDTTTSASNLTINSDAASSGILKLMKGTTEEITIYETSNIAAFETATGNSIWLIPNGDTNAVVQVTTAGHVVPVSANQDLGSSGNPWRDIYVSSGSLLLANKKFSVNASGQVTITDSSTDAPVPLVTSELIVTSSNGSVKMAVQSDGTLATTTAAGGATTGTYSGSFSGSYVGDTIGGLAISSLLASSSIAGGVATLSGSAHTQRAAVVSQLSGSAHTQRAALDTAQTTARGTLSSSLDTRIKVNETFKSNFDTAFTLSSDDVTILGDLTVQGATTTLNTATLDVEDLNITVANGAADAAAANGAGLTVDGASATLTYASTGDKWVFNKVVDVPTSGILINGTAVTATAAELNQLDANTVGGTSAGDIVTIDGSQTLSNKTIAASQVTEISGLTDAEGAQLENIDTTTISAAQWGYLGSTSTFGGSLIDDADAAAARTTLGLGTVATLNSIDISDNTNFAVSDTTGQTGINLTLTDDTVSGVVSGLGTSSDVQFDSLGIGTAASGTTGEIRATGDITAYYSSDERLKENFKTLDGALDKVNQLNGYEFDWKEGIEDVVSKTGHDIGVKAQEVQALYPELVHERDNGYLAVDYVKLTAVLLQAVKELSAKVDELSK